MAKTFTCLCCRCRLPANPRVKNQRYCGKDGCQRQRKRKWQQIKMASDPDYRANQQDAYRAWRECHPDYWRHRRQQDPPASLSLPAKPISPTPNSGKMDTIEPLSLVFTGTYLITPLSQPARKMDAIKVKIVPFSPG